MNTLFTQQEALQSYLLAEDEEIFSMIDTPPIGNINTRLNVYREAYYLRLIEVIQSDFETLYELLGEENFNTLARQYIETYPSCYFSLDDYAKDFTSFIKKYVSECDYEIAHFEWTIAEIRLLKAEAFIIESDLQAISRENWGALSFTIQSHARIMTYQHNVLYFYEESKRGDINNTCDILVWQKAHVPFYLSLSHDQKMLFNALREGASFITLCEMMCAFMLDESVPGFVSETLREFIKDELITGFTVN